MSPTNQGQLGTVVVGLDGSENSRSACNWAATEAEGVGARLLIIHAFPLQTLPMTGERDPKAIDSEREVDAIAADLRTASGGRLTTEASVVDDFPTDTLVRASRVASMVVVGTRGLGDFGTLVLGSVSAYVAAHASCPVAVVPLTTEAANGVRTPPPTPDAPVVVGVGLKTGDLQTLDFAFDRAQRLGRPLRVVHVRQPLRSYGVFVSGPYLQSMDLLRRDRADQRLVEELEGWADKYPQVPITHKVVLGHPVGVLAAQTYENVESVIVGPRGGNTAAAGLLGSVSQRLLHHARRPVIIAR